MRPITLTMQAFGSYGKKAVIDFTSPKQNLFLVTGETGAGKTTIFDAIVYALYGEASSDQNKKTGFEMVSQFVEPGTEPFVELEFSEVIGGETLVYTVKRIPSYFRKKDRGSGLKGTAESEKVILTMPDGSTYPAKETNKKLIEIAGLSKGQFMQIAMIAQGEFMELLRAKSDDKKLIFRKLFGTELYQNIVDKLAAQKKEKETEFAKIKTACQTVIANVELPESGKDEETSGKLAELRDLKKQILGSDKLNIAVLEKLIHGLEELCADLKDDQEILDGKLKEASDALEKAKSAYTKGETIQRAFLSLEAAEEILHECSEVEDSVKEKSILSERISASYELQNVFQLVDNANETVKQTKENLKKQKEFLPDLKDRETTAGETEATARSDKDAATSEYATVSEKVDKALVLFEQINRAEETIRLKGEAHKEACAKCIKANSALQEFDDKVACWRNEEQKLSDANVQLVQWNTEGLEIAGVESDLADVDGAFATADRQRKVALLFAEAYARAKEEYNKKNEEYLGYNQAYLDSQAGFLAKTLTEGRPCPVCGSLEHPNPCRIPEVHKELTRERLDTLFEEVQTLRNQAEKKSEDSGKANQLFDVKKKQAEEKLLKLEENLKKSRPDVPDEMSLEEAEQILGVWKREHTDTGVLIQKNADRQKQLQSWLAGVEKKRSELSDALEKARLTEMSAANEKTASETSLQTLIKQKEFASEKEALKKKADQKAVFDKKNEIWKEADKTLKKAKSARESAETLITQFEAVLPGQEEQAASAKRKYSLQLQEKEIGEEEWKSIVADYPRTAPKQLQDEVTDFNKKKAAAEGSRKAALDSIGSEKKPDMDVLMEARQEAEAQYQALNQEFTTISTYVRENGKVLDKLTPQMERRGQVVREYERIDSLHVRLAGKVKDSRMDIETYVQRYYLQRILHAANRHFFEMSAGQYELRMVSDEEAGRGKNRGLDLTVYSNVTGQIRGIKTLSGGESFMAALAMALGMADQIQEKSAAINLDIMFIDEGFGSLDDHSRSQAVKVLQQMAMGSRLIGIISHVTELKQEIDDQLIIKKDEEGSHARWQLS